MRLTKQGVRNLGQPKGTRQPVVYKYWWGGSKIDGKWIACRKAWFDQNLPNHQGRYKCALCGKSVLKEETTLDHIVTRSRDPKLKYDLKNLQPAHFLCNHARGSLTMEEWNKKRGLKVV